METGLKRQQVFPSFLIASAVSVMVAAPAFSQIIQVTGVRVQATANGVEVILETESDTVPQVSTTTRDKTLVTNIFNTQLQLPESQEFRQENPAAGIASVTVTQVSPNTIRVTVIGTTEVPQATITPGTSGLVLSVTPAEEEEIEIVVTAEQAEDTYFAPSASTATLTDTPIRDTPQSIQVIPQQVLEDQQVVRLEEALSNVSGVTYGGTFAGVDVDFTIRGFNNAPILRDGFRRLGDINDGIPETANIERVEVLKGPASILYGEIQPGGVINLVSKQPLAEPYYSGEIRVGNREFLSPQFDFSGPLTEDGRLRYRFNTLYRYEESFRNYNQEIERFMVAPVLSYQLGNRTDLTVQLEYSEYEGPFEIGLPAVGNDIVDVPLARITNEPDDFVESEFLSVGYRLEHRFSDNWRIRNAFRYMTQDLLDVGAIPLDFDEATGILNRGYNQQDRETKDYSFQTNIVGEFATGSINHTLLFGADLNRSQEREITGFDVVNLQPLNIFDPQYGGFDEFDADSLPLLRDNDIETDRVGIFVQEQIKFLDNLILVAGLRYDTVERNAISYPNAFDPIRTETNRNYDAFTPRLGIVYQPIPSISLYGSYSRSFTPNLSATTETGDFLDPEEGEGYELGVKAEWLEGRLSTTLAYFDITKKNVATTDPNNPLFSIAAGEQRSRGVELDVVGRILPGWNIIASYAYTDAKITEDNTFSVGNRLFNVPRHSASLWTTYEFQQGSLEGLGFGLGFNYVGERQGDLANSFEVDSYFLTNAAIFYRRDNLRFAINVKNLFDVNYIAATQNSRTFLNEPGAPLTIIGSFGVEF